MHITHHPRSALSLTDVVVLVLLLLVLGAIILTALPGLWNTSYRTQCANNLKHIGEGSYFFEGATPPHLVGKKIAGGGGPAHQTLPPARIADGYATWAVVIAPYMTNDHPLKNWDLSQTYFDQPASVRTASFRGYFCPARNRSSKVSTAGDVTKPGDENVPGAVGDYACAVDVQADTLRWTTTDAVGAIIMAEKNVGKWKSLTSLDSLVRGLSNTILVGEKHVPANGFGNAAFGDGSLYDGRFPANFSRVGGPGYGIAPSDQTPFRNQFGSAHPEVCQFLMADCSVRPMDKSINEGVLEQLIRRE